MPTPRMPVVFVGHGSPMNAITDNRFSRGFTALGASLPRPRAILAISAHWYVDGTFLTSQEEPPVIYDFGGFPQALYEVQYPASGHADLARTVERLLSGADARLSDSWGLDHGTWTVLKWMVPDASVPVVQLSIDRRLAPAVHAAIGHALAPLRDEGVLIFASGNVTHNLRDAFQRMRTRDTTTPPWARRFDEDVAAALVQRDTRWLTEGWHTTDAGRAAHPSADHYLPLLYAHGATTAQDTVRFPIAGFDLGSISMRTMVAG